MTFSAHAGVPAEIKRPIGRLVAGLSKKSPVSTGQGRRDNAFGMGFLTPKFPSGGILKLRFMAISVRAFLTGTGCAFPLA